MWKPGTEKPNQSSGKRAKVNPPGQLRTTELSGTTRNMRFMQRKTPKSGAEKEKPDADSLQSQQATAALDSRESVVETEKSVQAATNLDMYSYNGSVPVGRRSFGGFNPVVASNWYSQQKEKTSKKEIKISDEELLRRFATGRSGMNKKRQSPGKGTKNQGKISGSKKRKNAFEEMFSEMCDKMEEG
jgi:hypothetical protein